MGGFYDVPLKLFLDFAPKIKKKALWENQGTNDA